MRRISFDYSMNLESQYLEDTIELTRFIASEFDLYITIVDAYHLWKVISKDMYDMDIVPVETVKSYKSMLVGYLQKYCYLG